MSDHLRRKVEQWICAHLTAAVPELVCVPSDGDEDLEPPYAVAVAEEDSNPAPGEMTSLISVDVIYATSIFDTQALAHSGQFKKIQLALWHLLTGDFRELGLIVHGADVMGSSSVSDRESKSHGDVVTLSVGATDMDIATDDLDLAAGAGGSISRRSYYARIGDGTARSFTVRHNLGTDTIAAILLREAGEGGAVFVHGRDYTLAVVDANTLTLTLLEPRTGAVQSAGIATPGINGLLISILAAKP